MSIQEKLNIFTVAKDFTVWNNVWQLPGCEQRMLTLLKRFLMKRENVTELDPRQCPQHRSKRLSDDPKGRWKNSHVIRLGRANYGTVKERVPGHRGLRADGKESDRGELISQSLRGERTAESGEGVDRVMMEGGGRTHLLLWQVNKISSQENRNEAAKWQRYFLSTWGLYKQTLVCPFRI